MVRMLSGMDSVPPRFEDAVTFLIPSSKGPSDRSFISRIVLEATCYFIWQERNTSLPEANFYLIKEEQQSCSSDGSYVEAS
ncbi:hypothetical protein Tco_0214370 [Tanacetum coccineum]